ncbi:MAG: transporter [Dysgonomonadaceae bacterium]|nr:transporter [Dysgonamonadaceae bacterium]
MILPVFNYSLTQWNVIAATWVKNTLVQGWSFEDANRLASNSLFQTVQVQAVAVSIKTIAGWMLIFGIILLVIIILYFLRFAPVKLIMIGRDMAGE